MSSISSDQRTVVQVITARMLERPPRALDIQEIAAAMRSERPDLEADGGRDDRGPHVDVRA